MLVQDTLSQRGHACLEAIPSGVRSEVSNMTTTHRQWRTEGACYSMQQHQVRSLQWFVVFVCPSHPTVAQLLYSTVPSTVYVSVAITMRNSFKMRNSAAIEISLIRWTNIQRWEEAPKRDTSRSHQEELHYVHYYSYYRSQSRSFPQKTSKNATTISAALHWCSKEPTPSWCRPPQR